MTTNDCTHDGRWSTGPDGGPSVCGTCGTIRPVSTGETHTYRPTRAGVCDTCGRSPRVPSHAAPEHTRRILITCQCGAIYDCTDGMSAAIDHRDMTGHLTWSAAPAPEGSVADLIAASERRAADQGQAPEIDAERVALQAPGRRRARVCGDCWYVLRPDQYLPGDTYGTDGECSMCGGWAYALHRVAWAEIDAERAVDRERAMHRFPQD